MLAKLKSLSFLIAPIILFLGILLRFIVYYQNRSLIIDEANLARNIVEKNGLEFFQSLDYQQYCPPVFLIFSKWSTVLFGVNEFSLKMLPLLGGGVLLFCFWTLLKVLVKEQPVHWYLLLVLSFSTLALRYSTELKQYSLDAMLTLALIYLSIRFKEVQWNLKNTLIWLVLGSLMIWTSMPSIFVLAAIGFAFLYQSWVRDRNIPFGLVIAGVVWLANFGVYFLTVLYQDSTSDLLQDYHQNFFFEFLPRSVEDLSRSYYLIIGLMTSVTDRTAIGLLFCTLFLSVGIYQLIKNSKFEALLLLLPILFALIASNMKLYSLISRLSLFLIPILLLLMGIGLSFVWEKTTNLPRVIIATLMLISIINKEGYKYFVHRMEFEDTKSTMAFLAQNRSKEDLVFVQHDAVPAFTFYNSMHDNAYHFEPVYLAKWKDRPHKVLPQHKWNSKVFWLFFAHTFPKEKTTYLKSAKRIARPVSVYESQTAGVNAFLVK